MGKTQRKRKASAEDGSAPVSKKNARNDGTPTRAARARIVQAPSARVTRGMTTRASRDVVFKTAELLEGIILHLPNHTIIALPRVCQLFKAQVEESPAIQQKFKRLNGKGTETWTASTDRYQYIRTRDAPSDPRFSYKNMKVPSRLNPLFINHLHNFVSVTLHPTQYMKRAISHALQGRSLPMFTDMHFTDAAPTNIQVCVSWSDAEGGYGIATFYQHDNAGCTIGKALQGLRDFVPTFLFDSRRERFENSKTVEEIFQSGGKKLRMKSAWVKLFGVLLPTDAFRSACLPLPALSAE